MSESFGLREAIEHSLASFFLSRPDGTILDANQAAVDLFGWTKEELRSIGRDGLFDTRDPIYKQSIRHRDRVGKVSAELTAIHKDGRRFPVEFNSVLFTGNDRDAYSSTFITDLTERKRTDREIQLLINNTAEAYILVDQELKILSFNVQFQRLYHRYFGIDVVKGDSILTYSPKERKENAKRIYMRVLLGETVVSTITVDHPGDGRLHYSLTYAPAKDEMNQVIGAFVTAANITERLAQEKILVESHQRFHFVTKATSDAIWDWNLITGIVYWGEGFHTTFGYPKEIVEGSADEWKSRMHPDDREQVEAIVRDAILSHAETVGAEYRYRKANGSYAIVSDRAVIVRNEKGEPIRLVGAMQDITLAKHKERQRLLLAEIAQISAQSPSLQTMIDHSLHKIVMYGGYLLGEIWMVDPAEHFCYLASDYRGSDAAIQFSTSSKDIRTFRKGDGLPGITWKTAQIQILRDVQHDPLFLRREAAQEAGLHTFFGIPLMVHTTVVGILLLGSTDANADLDLLVSQFDRVGAFMGMEIHRKQQEDLLRRIAWEQSHLVRAPLARLLGLADLISNGHESPSEVDEMLAQIVSSAKELDHIIRGISSSTATTHPSSKP
jgi:PAS domain S-box-containing protein